MPRVDLPRVVKAARQFIAAITRHARQYHAPGYEDERHLGGAAVIDAGSELHLALEGRTIFDPPTPPDESPVRTFVGKEMDAAVQLRVIGECLRRLLRRIGYVGEQVEGAAFGRMPSMKGLEDLAQVGLPELPDLILATDELEALADTPTLTRLESTSPPTRLQVFDRDVPLPGIMTAGTAASSESSGDERVLYERLDRTTGWFSKRLRPSPT